MNTQTDKQQQAQTADPRGGRHEAKVKTIYRVYYLHFGAGSDLNYIPSERTVYPKATVQGIESMFLCTSGIGYCTGGWVQIREPQGLMSIRELR